uniref:mitochondrial processing peptidase n=1 Tax=Mucochytrium quahogii TaxID=96639 RepID=A0A7S2RWJ8_9STRA|mmetsp:Transcript_17465/g.28219  ORF Transcript_17465/g.28219 Transcript_17465/m.28219 type:complete len:470 (+) Transcript_17465:131-1540(+)|eukprot:CAMPEP_0203744762 /NCGR_PEP_ID=MMETSP0098-20131031/724_1 /ASSEMBLY_ACC=CAM_ASM_000208 /TAXON_ID=96639 /ORGANISM=" , Strain NY0313808BC1" /LENGTH=469 /DNA_ID=CAMNT_0050632375 /DNA_START=144 /DNA_END=1553 /DNA_ORIENTATION=+
MLQNGLRSVSKKLTHVRGLSSSASGAFPQYVLNAPATEVSTLGNGLRVASEGGHGETATVGVWIDAGSRYETEKNNGVAHFLEHMMFKGTGNRTQTQLEKEVENIGGHLNAYTSREQTVFYAKVFKEDVPQAMDILSDIVQNATFDANAVNRERDVILREMQEVEENKEEVVFDRLHETAYQGTGLGRTILGPTENILSITRDDLSDYIQTHYTAPRVVVAGAGAVDHTQLSELADKHFGTLPQQSSKPEQAVMEPAKFTGSEVRVREDSYPVAHIALAFESAGWASEDAFPLMVMQTLLGCWSRTNGSGNNMSSKLCQAVAENECAHSIMSFNSCYKDTGLFGVYAVCDPIGQNDLAYYTLESMVRLCHNTTEEEVARARTNLKSTMLSHLDGSSQVCEDIGRQMLTYGRRLTPAEIFARIDAVDAATVKQVASKYINDQDIALAAIGPIHELPDYNWLRRRTYWLSV